jgi:hypothetical protein
VTDLPGTAGDLPETVRSVLSALLTAEVTTLGRDGMASAWPMVPLWLPERGRFVLSTSIGFPAKIAHLRRDPRIALLFSDVTGSGLDRPPVVLVQGTATVSDGPLTLSDDLLAHWRRVNALQPVSRHFSSTAPARWFMDWYYVRFVLEVSPHRVLWWPDRDTTTAPKVLDVAGVADDPGGPVPPEPGLPAPHGGATGDLVARLARFDDAVLTARDDRGRPVAVRGRPRVEGDRVVWPDAPGTGLVAGPAALLCHGHDEKLWNLRAFSARGRIDPGPGGDGWTFRADRVVDGTGMHGPLGDLAGFVAARRTAGRWLARRGLERPRVPWDVLRRAR